MINNGIKDKVSFGGAHDFEEVFIERVPHCYARSYFGVETLDGIIGERQPVIALNSVITSYADRQTFCAAPEAIEEMIHDSTGDDDLVRFHYPSIDGYGSAARCSAQLGQVFPVTGIIDF